MIIRNPINPYPQNIAVDPDITSINFTFSGDRLGSYKINIYTHPASSEGEIIYESKIINIENYAYNNTNISTTMLLSDMVAFPAGEYTWEVIMSPYKNLGASGDEGFTFTSLRYFFEVAYIPQIIISPDSLDNGFMVNEEAKSYDYNNKQVVPKIQVELNNRKLNIEGYYIGGNIKYYYFELFDDSGNLIEQTNKIFSSKIEYNFGGFLPSQNYTLQFHSVSQKEQYVNIIFNIETTYSPKTDINYPPILICNEEEANVKIKWIKDSTAIGIASGEYSLDQDKGEVNIISGTITYDNISSFPIVMDKDNFTVGIKTTINDNTTKILDYINNNILYEIYMENYKILLRYGEIGSFTNDILELKNFKDNIVFGIQNYADPKANTGYMWYDGDNQVSNSEAKYLLVSLEQENKYSIILQNNNGSLTCQVDLITEE